MKLHTIIVSLWFMTSLTFASEVAKKPCPSGCGSVEHVFSKSIVKRYAEQNANSGLTINNDNEDVPTNIVEAVILFGQDTQLIDKDGNSIVPQSFKNTQYIVLPMYKSEDFILRKSIVSTISLDETSTADQILEKLKNQYKVSKILMIKYNAVDNSIAQDGIIICPPCSQKKRK